MFKSLKFLFSCDRETCRGKGQIYLFIKITQLNFSHVRFRFKMLSNSYISENSTFAVSYEFLQFESYFFCQLLFPFTVTMIIVLYSPSFTSVIQKSIVISPFPDCLTKSQHFFVCMFKIQSFLLVLITDIAQQLQSSQHDLAPLKSKQMIYGKNLPGCFFRLVLTLFLPCFLTFLPH